MGVSLRDHCAREFLVIHDRSGSGEELVTGTLYH